MKYSNLPHAPIPAASDMLIVLAICAVAAILAYATFFLVRRWSVHLHVEALAWHSLRRLSYTSRPPSAQKWTFPSSAADRSAFALVRLFPSCLVQIEGVRVKWSMWRLEVAIDAICLHIRASWLQPFFATRSNAETRPFHTVALRLLPLLFKLLHIRVHRIVLLAALDGAEHTDAAVQQGVWIEELAISSPPNALLFVKALVAEQIVAENTEQAVTPTSTIIQLSHLVLHANLRYTELTASIADRLVVNIGADTLYFLACFFKTASLFGADTNAGADVESDISVPDASSHTFFFFFIPWTGTLRLKLPDIDVQLVLPRTDTHTRLFERLQVSLHDITGLLHVAPLRSPKITMWASLVRAIAHYDHETVGARQFCPIDTLLQRGAETLVGTQQEILLLENGMLCNWDMSEGRRDSHTERIKHTSRTTLPTHIIKTWLASVLQGAPLWSIATPAPNAEIASLHACMEQREDLRLRYEKLLDRVTAEPLLTTAFFAQRADLPFTVFALFDRVDCTIPFEFPFSSLVDHAVILFKAGLRPVSRRTERGYWAGDGDRVLRHDWAINAHAKRARLRIEDDRFEARLSVIIHCQRMLAETRTRLDLAFWKEFPPTAASPSATRTWRHRLAQSLSVSQHTVTDGHVEPLLEMHRALFAEYRSMLSARQASADCMLIDMAMERVNATVSWSPAYLQPQDTISNLLNRMESPVKERDMSGGQELGAITDEIVATMTTLIGGFVDLFATNIHISLRNYARPLLLAPDLRIVGPVFLVEAGVQSPDVLISYPVHIATGKQSNLPFLPASGAVDVVRSILPLKLYHCVNAVVGERQLCQMTVSPYWAGCLSLLDRALDRFVKASTEDPSPPLPGWDKMRHHLRGCFSRLSIHAPCLISLVADPDPYTVAEELLLSLPRGINLGLVSGGRVVLQSPESALLLKSRHLSHLQAALQRTTPVWQWDHAGARSPPDSPAIPVITLTDTRLELRFDIRNPAGDPPCHHWLAAPTVRGSTSGAGGDYRCSSSSSFSRSRSTASVAHEEFDSFRHFRSKSIGIVLSGVVGDQHRANSPPAQIRLCYYRELERWISRFLLAPHSDIDCVKRGVLHQSAAIPEPQHQTSFASVFRELHLAIEFVDLFVPRILNFSTPHDAQALWIASHRSVLNMDWRRGTVDKHGRTDWVYYYGEIEFLDVHFSVSASTSTETATATAHSETFPIAVEGVVLHNLLRAPRLLYVSLDEKCFQWDAASMRVQCRTVTDRRRVLARELAVATAQLRQCDVEHDSDRIARLTSTINALQSRQRYYDSFLIKIQRGLHLVDEVGASMSADPSADPSADLSADLSAETSTTTEANSDNSPATATATTATTTTATATATTATTAATATHLNELVDASHYEVYNAQLVWNTCNRDIVFKLVDELFVAQKKRFSQHRAGLVLMRKMATLPRKASHFSVPSQPASPTYCFSPTDTIDSFFETLLERKSNLPSPTTEGAPFIASPEPANIQRNETSDSADLRSPTALASQPDLLIPRTVDLNLFNPQLCLFTPSTSEPGVILITAKQARVEFAPVWDRHLDLLNADKSETELRSDPKIGSRTKITLARASIYAAPRTATLLDQCYAQDTTVLARLLKRITEDSRIVLMYDVSNVGYQVTGDSPRTAMFGHGDAIVFSSGGIALATTSSQFRSFLDVIIHLLVYRDPNQEARAEQLETLLLAANLSDRRMFALRMGECRVRLDQLRQMLMHARDLELTGELLQLQMQFDATERELALVGEAMRTLHASIEKLAQKQTRLALSVHIDRIQWTLLMAIDDVNTVNTVNTVNPVNNAHSCTPVCHVALEGIVNQWTSKEDGSMENAFEIASASLLNQLPHPFYRNVLRPLDYRSHPHMTPKAAVDFGCLVRFFSKSRLPVNGITVLDHVELDLSPLQLQLTLDIANRILRFFFPDTVRKSRNSRRPTEETASPPSTASVGSPPTLLRSSSNDALALALNRDTFDEIHAIKTRAQQNVYFVYVKVPASQHLLSYKGTGRTSIVDIDRFVLSLPEFEYQNRLWSWPDFFNQLRRGSNVQTITPHLISSHFVDAIVVLIKNLGSLFKDKLKKLGRRNVSEDEQYFRNVAERTDTVEYDERITVSDPTDPTETRHLEQMSRDSLEQHEKKTFMLFGKSLLKLMKR